MKSLIKEIEDKFEEIEESNVTGNLDGGEGPPRTPYAFAKSKDEDDLDDEHIEVLGYKRSKEKKMNTKKLESLERKLERIVNQNAKLKTEAGVHNGQYWKSTQRRFGKISERMLNVARKIKELSV